MAATKKSANQAIAKLPKKKNTQPAIVAKNHADGVKKLAKEVKRIETAITTPVPARALVVLPGDKDGTEITISNVQGIYELLRMLGKKKCYITLFMRGKCHEMTRKYHPDSGDPNPYKDVLVKYSRRAAWVNLPSQEVKDRFAARQGLAEEPMQDHRYAEKDPFCPMCRVHESNGQLYMAFNPCEGFQYNEWLMNKDDGSEITREEIEDYCGRAAPATWFKNVKIESIIEIKGGYYVKKNGKKTWKRFRYRNYDNITSMDTAIADQLPIVAEQPEDYVNPEDEELQ